MKCLLVTLMMCCVSVCISKTTKSEKEDGDYLYINLSDSEFQYYLDSLYKWPHVKHLFVDYLSNDYLSESLKFVRSIEYLDIGIYKPNVNLESFFDLLGNCKNLKRIDFFCINNIDLPTNISIFSKLESISFQLCNTISFPKTIIQLKELDTLIISSSLQTDGEADSTLLPQNIEYAKYLKHLEITNIVSIGNNIDSAFKTLVMLKNLEVLKLFSCGIRTIPEKLKEMQNLRELSFLSNKIERIPGFIADMENLETIDLTNNNLREIDISLGKRTSDLIILHYIRDKKIREKFRKMNLPPNIKFYPELD